jgi:hypothetical protein
MRVIKMYGWQVPFSKLVSEIRAKEMGRITFTNILRALNMAFFFAAPSITAFLTLAPYALAGNVVVPADVSCGEGSWLQLTTRRDMHCLSEVAWHT